MQTPKKELRIVGPVHNASGYAAACRAILRSANLAGYRVQAVEAEFDTEISLFQDGRRVEERIPMFLDKPVHPLCVAEREAAFRTRVADDAPTIVMTDPFHVSLFHEFGTGARIGLSMLESDTVHPLWARSASNLDLLLAPSSACAAAFSKSVKCPVGFLPLPVDERLWSDAGEKMEILDEDFFRPSFLFCSVFSTCERKHWRLMLQAFAEEFRGEDVGLVVKCNRGSEVEELAQWLRTAGAWIKVYGFGVKGIAPRRGEYLPMAETEEERKDSVWTDEKLASFYRACDAYIGIGAEGFGMPLVEAAYCGLPLIGLDGGGTKDILDDIGGWRVPAIQERAIGQVPQVYPSSHKFPTCSLEGLRETLRDAYEFIVFERHSYRECAIDAFSPATIAEMLPSLIEEAQELRRGTNERYAIPLDLQVPPITVIMTTHFDVEETEEAICALKQHTERVRIILADDHSDEEMAEMARRQGVLLVPAPDERNLSSARNAALEQVKEGYVCFMDNDVMVTPEWWARLWDVFRRHPEIGILAPQKNLPDGSTQNVGRRIRYNAVSFGFISNLPVCYPDYLECACMIVREEVWKNQQFDEGFPFWYEDVDYCFQARENGFEVAATPLVKVIHNAHGASREYISEIHDRRKEFLTKWRHRL